MLDQRADSWPASAQTQLAYARELLAERRAAEAMMLVEQLLARHPSIPAAEGLRAEIMAAIAATNPALAMLELNAALNDDQAAPQVELAHAYAGFDRPADAERCFKRVLALEAASAEAHAGLAALYLGVEIRDGAEHHARRALALDEAHVVASQTLASLLEARGETDEAAALLDRAYRRQALFVQPAVEPRMSVLVLATVSAGNIPYRFLMPATAYTRLVWYMEHARDAERPPADRYDLVFNTIGDADLAEPSDAAVRAFLADCPRPFLNAPEQVARTRRDRLGALLADIPDVVVPTTVRLDAGDPAAAARDAGIEGPFLLRPVGSHGGQGLRRIDEGETAPPAEGPHYVTAYVDYSGADGLFRKHRMVFVDREPYPYHLAISERWLVHHATSGMTGFEARRAEEARFLDDPEAALGAKAMAAIRAIGARLDLDYCGVDFGVLPDGRVLVFEANATMLVHTEAEDGAFAQKNPFVLRIAEAFQAHLARVAGR